MAMDVAAASCDTRNGVSSSSTLVVASACPVMISNQHRYGVAVDAALPCVSASATIYLRAVAMAAQAGRRSPCAVTLTQSFSTATIHVVGVSSLPAVFY